MQSVILDKKTETPEESFKSYIIKKYENMKDYKGFNYRYRFLKVFIEKYFINPDGSFMNPFQIDFKMDTIEGNFIYYPSIYKSVIDIDWDRQTESDIIFEIVKLIKKRQEFRTKKKK